jgi:hypothetical protein
MHREMCGVCPNFVEQTPLASHWRLPDLKLSRQSRIIWE